MTSESRPERDARQLRDGSHRGAPPRGTRQISALLPNGRTVWLRVEPTLAPGAALNHVARLAEQTLDQRRAALAELSDATERLTALVGRDASRLRRQELSRTRRLGRRVVAGDNRLDARLAKLRDEFASRLDRQLQIDRENLRRLRRRDFWDKILLATSMPLFAAYGQPGSPFATNNLTLTFLLLVFLVGEEVVGAIFGGSRGKSKYALADADAWSYLAPIANALAAWWLLGGRQHERFVTGVTTVRLGSGHLAPPDSVSSLRYRARIPLEGLVAEDHYEDFETFKGVPTVATIARVRFTTDGEALQARTDGVSAKVVDGVLKLSVRVVPQTLPATVPASLGEVDVAWMIDTSKPADEPAK